METNGIIVLGMHRSGTSCLAGMLESAGFHADTVEQWSPDNNKGSRENTAIVQLNDSLLKEGGGAWNQPDFLLKPTAQQLESRDKLIQSLAHDNKLWMFKDPRTLLTLSFWLDSIPDGQMLGVFRHPFAVANSLSVRNSMSLRDGLRLWAAYNKELLKIVESKNVPLLYFSEDLESFVNSSRQVLDTYFPKHIRSGELKPDQLGDFVSRDLVHQVQSLETLIDTGPLSAELAETESEAFVDLWRALLSHSMNKPKVRLFESEASHAQKNTINNTTEQNSIEVKLASLEQRLCADSTRMDLWQQGVKLIEQEGTSQMLEQWIAMGLSCNQDNPSILFEQAKLAWQTGDEDKAIQELEEVCKLAPGWIPALNLLAEWYFEKEDWQKAAKTLHRLSAHGHLAPSDLNFAQIFIDSGQGFNEEESIRLPIVLNNRDQEIKFKFSGFQSIERIRFDPLNDYAVVKVNGIQAFDADGNKMEILTVENNAQFVSSNEFCFADKDSQIHLKLQPSEASRPFEIIASLHYVHTGTAALLECFNRVKEEKNREALIANDKNSPYRAPTTETANFLSGWALEQTETADGNKKEPFLHGWVIPKNHENLNIVFRYGGLTRSYDLNIDRPDILEKFARTTSEAKAPIRCGFKYAVPMSSLIEIGIEHDMRLYWIESVHT
jgi:hypothetical protein